MSKFVTWDTQNDRPKGSNGFLKLEHGNKYRVRLVSNAVQYFQHWDPVICRSPGADAEGKTVDPLMLMGYAPKKRYAIWVIHRDDENKLKIMDFPPTLFDQFVDWKSTFNNDNPGGSTGPDWIIKVERPGNDPKRTKYKANYLDRTPFTEEELKRFKEGISIGEGKTVALKERLAEVRRANTPDEIRDLLDKKGDPTGPSAPSSSEGKKSEAPKSEAPKPEAKKVDAKSEEYDF
jgi:hypothetical protein